MAIACAKYVPVGCVGATTLKKAHIEWNLEEISSQCIVMTTILNKVKNKKMNIIQIHLKKNLKIFFKILISINKIR